MSKLAHLFHSPPSPISLCSVAFPYGKLTCAFDRQYSFHAADTTMIPSHYSPHYRACAARHLPAYDIIFAVCLVWWRVGVEIKFYFSIKILKFFINQYILELWTCPPRTCVFIENLILKKRVFCSLFWNLFFQNKNIKAEL